MLQPALLVLDLLTVCGVCLGLFAYFLWLRSRYGRKTAWRRLFSYRLLLPAIVLLCLFGLHAGLVFVQPTEVGVVISITANQGVRPKAIESGLHWITPLAEKSILYPVSWQLYTLSHSPRESSRQLSDAIWARTADNQTMILDCSIIFRIERSRVVGLHINWQDRYREQFLRPALRGIIRDLVADYSALEALSGRREELETEINRHLANIAKEQGLIVKRVLLRNITFTEDFNQKVEEKQKELEKELMAEFRAERIARLAEGQARKVRLLASAKAEAVLIKFNAHARAILLQAVAEARALAILATAIENHKQVLQYRYIDRVAARTRRLLLSTDRVFSLPTFQRMNGSAPAR